MTSPEACPLLWISSASKSHSVPDSLSVLYLFQMCVYDCVLNPNNNVLCKFSDFTLHLLLYLISHFCPLCILPMQTTPQLLLYSILQHTPNYSQRAQRIVSCTGSMKSELRKKQLVIWVNKCTWQSFAKVIILGFLSPAQRDSNQLPLSHCWQWRMHIPSPPIPSWFGQRWIRAMGKKEQVDTWLTVLYRWKSEAPMFTFSPVIIIFKEDLEGFLLNYCLLYFQTFLLSWELSSHLLL